MRKGIAVCVVVLAVAVCAVALGWTRSAQAASRFADVPGGRFVLEPDTAKGMVLVDTVTGELWVLKNKFSTPAGKKGPASYWDIEARSPGEDND